VIERIAVDDWRAQRGHVYRYELAAQYLLPGERVLDAASGIGYGAQVLTELVDIHYTGLDKIEPAEEFKHLGHFHAGVDLANFVPQFSWDVSISFETLEHVEDPASLARLLKQARRLVILSTPTRPTRHFNPYHLHDFTPDEVLGYFDDWELLHIEDQPEELSHIFVWGRHVI
jgi:2-polyprenyl-3-methyl-5-hydroxy-6-metoxy-1,4-benzoquinol methylase